MIDYDKLKSIETILENEINMHMKNQSEEDTFENGRNHGYLTCLLKFKNYLKDCGVLI